MNFSEKTLKEAWKRAEGKCQMTVLSGEHKAVCGKPLEWERLCLGISDGCGSVCNNGGWTAQPRLLIKGAALDVPSNCVICCHECHHNSLPKTLTI